MFETEKAARYDAIMAKVESMGHTGAVQLIDALAGRCMILQKIILDAGRADLCPFCLRETGSFPHTTSCVVTAVVGWDPLKPSDPGLCYQGNWCQKYGGTLKPPVESPRRPQEPREGIIAVQTPESDRAELVALLERYGRGTPGRVWALFHDLWGKAHDSPHYNKREWMELQLTLEKLLPDK